MTDFRALCAELLDEFVYHTDWSDAEKLKERARAALAEPESIEDRIAQADAEIEASMGRIRKIAVMPAAQLAAERRALDESDGPAVLDGREPASVTGQPSDEELLELWQGWNLGWDPQKGMVLMPHPAEYARAVLARWGHQPAPPAEGEVAELVEWLREQLHVCLQAPWTPGIKHFGRAADLLERLAPQPPSLAEQALGALEQIDGWAVSNMNHLSIHDDLVTGVEAIRTALERLQELEGTNG